MPHAKRSLTRRVVGDLCAHSFKATGCDRFGIEAEWPTHRLEDIYARPTEREMARISSLVPPRAGKITFEPGGQVELSTAPTATIGEALRVLAEDAGFVHAALRVSGYDCATLAVDGRRRPQRVLEKARYEAMEEFFAAGGTSGSWMMNNTASTQVNVSHDEGDPERRWYTLNRIAPVLIAAFANSPGFDQRGQHWSSLRQAIWWTTDPGRTRPVRLDAHPAEAWMEYALDADVAFMCADGSDGHVGFGLPPGLPFGRWMHEGHDLGWPTEDDFRYHLSMLFPPVRPRGWLELRVIDALPDWIRTVACLVVAAACTAGAGKDIESAIPDTRRLWLAATQEGVRDPQLGRAADSLLAIARRHLWEVTNDADHHASAAEFVERYLGRRRMPGDDCPQHSDLREVARAKSFA